MPDTVNPLRVKLCLFSAYFIFAIFLNSVGTVILQVITTFNVGKSSAAALEGFKDISIVAASFLFASFVPRLGYRQAIILGLAIVALASLATIYLGDFLAAKILFLCVGVAFALVKVSVFATIGLVTEGRKGHASVMNLAEGLFMAGVMTQYFLFGHFIDRAGLLGAPDRWLDVYWVLAGICVVAMLFIGATRFPKPALAPAGDHAPWRDFLAMLKLMAQPLIYIFVASIFLYVLIEQGIGTWLPTFNKEVLGLPSAMSVQAASIFAGTLAIGRISAGIIMQRVSWYPVVNFCVLAMGLLVIFTLPLAQQTRGGPVTDWLHAPAAAFIFPLIGLFMAPIYPALNSVMLSALPRSRHAAMTGLIVMFSALGGTTGSLITGLVFGAFSGSTAFYLTLAPMTMIMIVLFFFRRAINRHNGGLTAADMSAA